MSRFTSVIKNAQKAKRVTTKVESEKIKNIPERSSHTTLSIEQITTAKQQPRRYFDQEKLDEMISSIRKYGILEPLIVRKTRGDKFEIVAGERRFRCAKQIGLNEIPVIVKNFSDEEAWEVAIIENIHRENLNPLDKLESILQLLCLDLKEHGIKKHDEVTKLLYRIQNENKGKVTRLESGNLVREIIEKRFQTLGIKLESFIRLELTFLNAPEEILNALRNGKLKTRNALELKKIKDKKLRNELIKEAISKNLSVKEIKEKRKEKEKEKHTTEKKKKNNNLTNHKRKIERIFHKINDIPIISTNVKLQKETEELFQAFLTSFEKIIEEVSE